MAVKNPKFEIPDLSNVTPEHLVDEIAKMRAMSNWIKKKKALYEEILYSKITRTHQDLQIAGDRFVLLGVRPGSMERLDTEKIKTEMSAEWVLQHSKVVKFDLLDLAAKGTSIEHDELNAWLKNLDSELFD